MGWIAIPLLLGAALYGIHRLALWAEDRGWIYYKNQKPGAYGTAFVHATSMFAPEIEHVIDEQQSEAQKAYVTESGDPLDDEDIFPGSVDFD